MFNQWCTIESDPGVFSELVAKIGAPSAQVEEIYCLEDDYLINHIKPDIYGFIFLFKWTKDLEKREALSIYDKDLFFARQIVNNACATQAILSVLLNAPISIQGTLKEFYEFTKQLSSEDRGLALSNSQNMRIIHNSFSRPQPFIFKEDKKSKKKQSDIYHFVSYVPHKGILYQLDGLQPGPILIGKYTNSLEWIDLAKQEIQKRINKYSEKQIRFNLLVVCENLKTKSLKDIQKLNMQKASITKKLKQMNKPYDEQILQKYGDVQAALQQNQDKLLSRTVEIQQEISHHQVYCEEQDHKAKERKQQNIRRKHNYVPLIIQMLKVLAKNNKLNSLIQKANKKQQKQQ